MLIPIAEATEDMGFITGFNGKGVFEGCFQFSKGVFNEKGVFFQCYSTKITKAAD